MERLQPDEDGSPSIRLRTHGSRPRSSSSFSKYGVVSLEPPRDDAVTYARDAGSHSFFERGRDYESAFTNHSYTTGERETLATFESLDYLPSHSEVYKNWLKRQPKRLDWDRWVMMGLIGFSVGFMGFLLHQIIDLLSNIRLDQTHSYIKQGKYLLAWAWIVGFGTLYILVSSASVVFLRPSAAGSGIPELIGFLNGTLIRHIFNIKTMVVKFFSCCLAVASGMPVGPEGPMIHLGSLVGAGLSQFKSDTLKVRLPFFERFRNSEDRRNFISAGAAAGVASAFGAPVGGLLFSMEEVSSFWNDRLSWQIFFCCMVSVFTTNLFDSSFDGFEYRPVFGMFRRENIIFYIPTEFDFHLLIFIPAILLGATGGFLGAAFTFLNLKITRLRKTLLTSIRSAPLQKAVRLAEPTLILIIYLSLSVLIPQFFYCSSNCNSCLSEEKRNGTCSLVYSNLTNPYSCEKETGYNEVATLLLVNGEKTIQRLFSRGTQCMLGYGSLTFSLVVYFLMACWSSGTSVSSGLVVPMLLIGGLYGRLLGRGMVDIFGDFHGNADWGWLDPGGLALIGAASFFGGVSRLTMSLTVIMIEITNDVQFLLPIMVAIMVAKWVGDFATHPLYHALLELKCIPFLAVEPVVMNEAHENMNMELFSAQEVMSEDVVCFRERESVQKIADALLTTPHGGFPITRRDDGHMVFTGIITRLELTILLQKPSTFTSVDPSLSLDELDDDCGEVTSVEYEQMTLDKLSDPATVEGVLRQLADPDGPHAQRYIELRPYVNQSAVSVRGSFSLHRTYIIFRSLGLRHLTVVDNLNRVIGMVTRKDLMGFNLEEKLSGINDGNVGNGRVSLRVTEDSGESQHRLRGHEMDGPHSSGMGPSSDDVSSDAGTPINRIV